MSREFEPDPEVLADLRLRDDSMRDTSRTRGHATYDWKPAKIVGAWGCRRPGCAKFVEVTQDAVDFAGQCDTWLEARGEETLHRNRVAYCDICLAEYKRTAPDRRRRQIDEMAVKIRALKESSDPLSERELVDQLTKMGHPDVTGLVQALAERRAAERSSGSRKKGW